MMGTELASVALLRAVLRGVWMLYGVPLLLDAAVDLCLQAGERAAEA